MSTEIKRVGKAKKTGAAVGGVFILLIGLSMFVFGIPQVMDSTPTTIYEAQAVPIYIVIIFLLGGVFIWAGIRLIVRY